MRDKYRRLSGWLASLDVTSVAVSFDELDQLVGGLPPSARHSRPWWANTAGNSQSAGWIRVGWRVTAVDLQHAVATFERGTYRPRGPRAEREPGETGAPATGRASILDGAAALDAFVIRAGWSSVVAAAAAHTVFLDPATVKQANGRALFPVVRDPGRRGQIGSLPDGTPVLFDDNTTPTDAFLWSADRVRSARSDVQFNHVWSRSSDPATYTALWNLCCTPAFLAKTTDTHPDVVAALKYRSFELYGSVPIGEARPEPPDGYDTLEWAAMPEPLDDLETTIRGRLRSARLCRASLAARTIGWAFSSGPDPTI